MSGNGFYGKFCAIIEDKLGVDLVNLVQAKMNGELYVPGKPMTQVMPVQVVNPVVKQQQKFVLEKVNNTFEISDGAFVKKIKVEQKGAYAKAAKLFAQLEQFYAQPVAPVKSVQSKPATGKKQTVVKATEEYEKASKLKNEISSKSKEIQK